MRVHVFHLQGDSNLFGEMVYRHARTKSHQKKIADEFMLLSSSWMLFCGSAKPCCPASGALENVRLSILLKY